jgi:hypothetical protein
MSCDEIRHWLSVLHGQFGWPWETLARTLGIGEGKHVASKLRGNSWIYPGEQIRMSRLDGYPALVRRRKPVKMPRQW